MNSRVVDPASQLSSLRSLQAACELLDTREAWRTARRNALTDAGLGDGTTRFVDRLTVESTAWKARNFLAKARWVIPAFAIVSLFSPFVIAGGGVVAGGAWAVAATAATAASVIKAVKARRQERLARRQLEQLNQADKSGKVVKARKEFNELAEQTTQLGDPGLFRNANRRIASLEDADAFLERFTKAALVRFADAHEGLDLGSGSQRLQKLAAMHLALDAWEGAYQELGVKNPDRNFLKSEIKTTKATRISDIKAHGFIAAVTGTMTVPLAAVGFYQPAFAIGYLALLNLPWVLKVAQSVREVRESKKELRQLIDAAASPTVAKAHDNFVRLARASLFRSATDIAAWTPSGARRAMVLPTYGATRFYESETIVRLAKQGIDPSRAVEIVRGQVDPIAQEWNALTTGSNDTGTSRVALARQDQHIGAREHTDTPGLSPDL